MHVLDGAALGDDAGNVSSRVRGMERSPRRADLRRSSHRAGLVAKISWRWAQVVKEASADRCRFQVAAAAVCQRSMTAA
ncbi:hypothetical protein [Nonomuraea polychroma]|uniref:hypothetical protein n=1 Tax=Nonomuraea polychroma TaxID=46176 RepID=UPI000FDE0700|nr:hypothetical protein [Nonomuraea polychroma]